MLYLRAPYHFISHQAYQLGRDIFEGTLFLKPVLFMTGSEAAKIFFDDNLFTRVNAAPEPLRLNEWLGRIGKVEKIKVSICGPGTYSPGDNCGKTTDGLELRAEKTQKHYLELEERTLRSLGRNPKIELGETPPWHRGSAPRQC